MAMLTNGLLPLFEDEFKREKIDGYQQTNLGVVFAQRILSLKTWALRTDRKHSNILIGGFLTPLLMAAAVPLSDPSDSQLLMIDFASLRRMGFLEPKSGSHVIYSFVGSDLDTHKVLLPNEAITRLDCLENLSFESGEGEDLANEEPAEALLSMRDDEGNATNRARTSIPLGSPRYYYSPCKERVRSKPMEHVFGELKKAHRWNKWNSRGLHNIKRSCKKKIKALEANFTEQLSGLKRVIETFVFTKKSPPRREDGGVDFDLAMEQARRHSTSHLPSSSSGPAFDPPRFSSHLPQSQGKRRHRHVPTPSPRSSDNESLHFSSSDHEETN